jgi:hypothetical protein
MGEPLRDRLTGPGAPARDDRDFSLQPRHVDPQDIWLRSATLLTDRDHDRDDRCYHHQ